MDCRICWSWDFPGRNTDGLPFPSPGIFLVRIGPASLYWQVVLHWASSVKTRRNGNKDNNYINRASQTFISLSLEPLKGNFRFSTLEFRGYWKGWRICYMSSAYCPGRSETLSQRTLWKFCESTSFELCESRSNSGPGQAGILEWVAFTDLPQPEDWTVSVLSEILYQLRKGIIISDSEDSHTLTIAPYQAMFSSY